MLQPQFWLLLAVNALQHECVNAQIFRTNVLPLRRQNATIGENAESVSTSSVASPTPTSNGDVERCAQSLMQWLSSSSSWSVSHNQTFVTTETYRQAGWMSQPMPQYDATSMTTLCDGHPRVVGSAQFVSTTTLLGTLGSYINSTYGVTQYSYNVPPYTVSTKPCTMKMEDCKSLYNVNTSLVEFMYSPICSLPSSSISSKSYSTNSQGRTCDACYLRASTARLLYWPVRTIDGTGDLCNRTARTTGLPRTGDGPNTFVTEGITITSPSIAISMASLSRADGCFSTYESTIVVLPASELMSVRGARALYDHQPFQYQDLNYRCQDVNSSIFWIQDEPGDNCYQEVPAVAYFSGESAFNWDQYYPTAYGPPLTIGPDYRPYILPPASMTKWANSVYNDDCLIQIDGIWDPPYALVRGTTVEAPHPAWQTTTSTADASKSSSRSLPPAAPAALKPGSTVSNPVPAWQTSMSTVGSEMTSSALPQSSAGPQASTASAVPTALYDSDDSDTLVPGSDLGPQSQSTDPTSPESATQDDAHGQSVISSAGAEGSPTTESESTPTSMGSTESPSSQTAVASSGMTAANDQPESQSSDAVGQPSAASQKPNDVAQSSPASQSPNNSGLSSVSQPANTAIPSSPALRSSNNVGQSSPTSSSGTSAGALASQSSSGTTTLATQSTANQAGVRKSLFGLLLMALVAQLIL